jgi:hypothetical protein
MSAPNDSQANSGHPNDEVPEEEANPNAYSGNTALAVSQGFANVTSTLLSMCLCVMCNMQCDAEDMVTVCQLACGGGDKRMEADTKIPPCMTCKTCAKKGKHEGRADDVGNKMCKACPKTLLALEAAYLKLGKDMPRGTTVRNGWCTHRFQPAGNAVAMSLLRQQVNTLQETVTANQQQADRTNRILSARLERALRNGEGSSSDAAPVSREERDERARELRFEAGDNSAAPTAADDAADDALPDSVPLTEVPYAAANLAIAPGGENPVASMDQQLLVGESLMQPGGQQALEEGFVDSAANDEEAAAAAASDAAAANDLIADLDGDDDDDAMEEELSASMEPAAAPAAADAESTVGDDTAGRAAMAVDEAAACEGGGAATTDDDSDDDEPLTTFVARRAKKQRTSATTHVSTAEVALPPLVAVPAAAAAASTAAGKRKATAAQVRKAQAKEAAATRRAAESDSDGEQQPVAATGPQSEAERAAANFRCPPKYSKQFREWKHQEKPISDFIEWMTLDKAKKDEVRKQANANAKNYGKVVAERDAAIARAEKEAKEKKQAVKRAREESKAKLEQQNTAIEQMMAFLAHIGVASADIGAIANGTLMAEAINDKYTKVAASGEGSGSGDADGNADGEAD